MGVEWRRKVILCRCNDVTLMDVEELISEGITSIEEIKRLTKIGMGPCQGRTCIPLLISLLARKTNRKISEIDPPTVRPPIRPLPAILFLSKVGEEG